MLPDLYSMSSEHSINWSVTLLLSRPFFFLEAVIPQFVTSSKVSVLWPPGNTRAVSFHRMLGVLVPYINVDM